jgi:D-lactate dehydrogenase
MKEAEGKIKVVRVPAYSPNAVAEHTVALLLSLTRHIPQSYNRAREGNFLLSGLVGRNLSGKTAGIVGTGRIGRIVAGILKGIGMKIVGYDVYPNTKWAEEEGVAYTDLDSLCGQADVICLHSPLTKETHHMIGEHTLSLMKKDAVIINTGRGGLLDAKALIRALKEKRIGGAALDVYEEEDKYFFEDWSESIITDDTLTRLLTFPNVLITGHQAFLTAEALNAIADTTMDNVKNFFASGDLTNEVKYQPA